MEVRRAHWFSIAFQFAALLQKLPGVAIIQPHADFELVKVTHTTSDNVDPQAVLNGGALIMITDNGTGRNLFDNPAPLDSISGRAQRPGILAAPYRFQRANSIGVELTNQGLAAQLVRLTLHGYKIYPTPEAAAHQ